MYFTALKWLQNFEGARGGRTSKRGEKKKLSWNALSHAYHDQTIKILCKKWRNGNICCETRSRKGREREREWEVCVIYSLTKLLHNALKRIKLLSVNYLYCIYYDRIRFYIVLLACIFIVLWWIIASLHTTISIFFFWEITKKRRRNFFVVLRFFFFENDWNSMITATIFF